MTEAYPHLTGGTLLLPLRVIAAAAAVRREWAGRQAIRHPFDTNHSFRCYHNTAYSAGILSAYHGDKSGVLNYGIVLFFPDELVTKGSDLARTVPAINWALLARGGDFQIEDVRPALRLADGLRAFGRALLEALTTGCLTAYLDEFYLCGSAPFLRQHNKHETLLTGYEPESGRVLMPFYGRDGVFKVHRLPLAAVLMAFVSSRGWPSHWGFHDPIDRAPGFSDELRRPVYRIRPTERTASRLDPELIRRQLEDVYHSRSTYRSYVGDPLTMWIEGPGRFGLAFYRAFSEYLTSDAQARGDYDLKITRLLWEHPLVMVERITALRHAGIAIDGKAEQLYHQLGRAAHWIHLHLLSHRGRPLAVDLAAVLAKLQQMEAWEKDAVARLLQDWPVAAPTSVQMVLPQPVPGASRS